jgi:preprotein translocase subunit SecD
MPPSLKWKWIVIATVVLTCVFGVVDLPKSKQELIANWNRNIRLGLDLKGGSHIVLQIQVQDAFKADADRAMEQIKDSLNRAGIVYSSLDRNEPSSIELAETIEVLLRGVPLEKVSQARSLINDGLGAQWTVAQQGPTDFRLNIRREAALKLRQDTLTQSMSSLERKVNGLGVAEASVQKRGGSVGDADILVQLPGVDDPARVKGILQTAAMLELSEVRSGPFTSQADALSENNGVLPLNTKLVRGSLRAGTGENWWLLARSPVVTGRDLRDARAQQSDTPGRWDTSFVLTQEAARRFERFTGANIGKRLAIVLDNIVLSAPQIESRISDQGRITGAGDHQEAADLALNLRSGSLPAGVRVIEELTVGPSLGADSIKRGMTAGLVGLALVVASMVLYYRGAGLNAVLALLLNTIMTIAALSYIDETWTLPGIAGMVLSIGMAVDSNVLIFERIKEEMRSGKTVVAAIGGGFDRALITIIDTHVTTIVASAFLFVFGTGPVRGFAVTLVIGLLANLFTAVFVSRSLFDVQVWREPRLTALSIGKDLFSQTRIDFLSRRNLTLGISFIGVVVSIASLAMKGGPQYGLDFRGGTLIYVRFEPKPSIDEIRQTLSAKLPGEVTVQETQGTGEFIIGTALADETTLERARQTVEQSLREKYADVGGRLDLNNASHAALQEKLLSALVSAGVEVNDSKVKELTARVLNYRDRDRNGIIRDIEELSTVEGVDARVIAALKQECGVGRFNLRSAEMVGPRAGEQMRRQALYATLGALGGMLAYIAYRFQWISGVAAVVATAHDVIITLGVFSLTDREITLNIIAALLTLIGYSMNDKIVVFDRVRENQRAKKRASSFLELVNDSINQTLSRTMLTAGPTLLACLALYFLGGEVLNGIAFALFVGIVIGTYSSIFVASALLVMWEQHRAHTSVARSGPAATSSGSTD